MEELFNDLVTYLQDEYSEDQENVLQLFIKNAVRAVCIRRYPYGYTDEQQKNAIDKYYNIIFDVAVYLYSKQGAEGQTQMSESGTMRSYESGGIPESYLTSITPLAKVM